MTGDLQDAPTSAGPPSYRTLTLALDGHVLASAPLQAADDTQALTLAKAMATAMARDFAVELWDGLRFIEHFDADHAAA